jgi:hypothetical protein
MRLSAAILFSYASLTSSFTPSAFMGGRNIKVAKSVSKLDMKYSVAVVGGGPSGACAAEIFAQEKGIDTYLFERKMDNAKPCGGAIPLCMIGEFDLPETVVDRKVRVGYQYIDVAHSILQGRYHLMKFCYTLLLYDFFFRFVR